ncbi:MAG: heparinase II/III family protein [Cohaesibacteraceae bacterium]|nr:heparinase II/III family protein [Cohaesibacteraceae bacterium]
MDSGLLDTFRLYAFRFRDALRRMRHASLAHVYLGPFVPGPGITRLLIAPQDLRTSDPTLASDFYSGIFVFAGHVVDCGSLSPFDVTPPSSEWTKILHGFSWLRHLKGGSAVDHSSNARALVEDWIDYHAGYSNLVWDTDIAASRVMSWLSQSPLLLEGCDHIFYRKFMRELSRHIKFLRGAGGSAPDGTPRLVNAISMTMAGLVAENQLGLLRTGTRRLNVELKRQILSDGGHTTRNPAVLVDILLDLLPLRQVFLSRGYNVPAELLKAIERIMPMLRFYRNGSGEFARFNGVGGTRADFLATLLAYDDVRGQPVPFAEYSGYARIDAGTTILLMDVGAPPPISLSFEACAGALSFELSSGLCPIVVNCGMPAHGHDRWRSVARATAAHSTLILSDTSSCRFGHIWFSSTDNVLSPIYSGSRKCEAETSIDEHYHMIDASHGGYLSRFGMRHTRHVSVSLDGTVIEGEDRLVTLGKQTKRSRDAYAVRFHIYPDVKISLVQGGDVVMLVLPNGENWEFHAREMEIFIEESVFLSDIHGVRRTEQIVLYDRVRSRDNVKWAFVRITDAKPPKRKTVSNNQDTLEV